MLPFEYHKASLDEIERLGGAFYKQHGDESNGIIPDGEFDRLFDHLAEALQRHGTFTEEGGEADFNGCRYVDQLSLITTVPLRAAPAAALAAALEAVATSHRPLAVSFDFPADELLVLPPNLVFTTFDESVFVPRM